MILNGLLTRKQISNLLHTYVTCINSTNNFSKEQLQRMKNTINQIEQFNQFHNNISSATNLTEEEREIKHAEIDSILGIFRNPNLEIFNSCRQNAENELQNYIMQNDQCTYTLNTIPVLVKEKIIK